MENSGQWNEKAVSHARSAGLDYWLTRDGVVMDFNTVATINKKPVKKGHVIEMKFDGASNPSISYTGKSKLKTDFLVAKAKQAIHAGSFAEVHLGELYPGVEMRNYIDAGRPRYDLIVKPGADASQIKVSFKGQTKLSVDSSGNLLMGTSLGDMKEAGLKAFTVLNGETTPVKAAFRVLAGNKVGFDLGAYDHKAKLVIDPLIYGSLFGGDNGRDCVYAVTSTPDGGVYMTGWTESIYFPVIEGAYQINLMDNRSAFVTLFRGDAYDVLYNSYLGGSTPYTGSAASDEGRFIQVSPDGTQLWLAGTTTSADFPLIDPNGWMPTPLNTNVVNSFVVSFSIDPTAYLVPGVATYFGPDAGATEYTLNGFVISPVDGSLLLAGTVKGTVAASTNVYGPVGPGSIDVWLAKMDSAGHSVVCSRYFGGSQDDSVTGLATDPDGDFVISGTVVSPLGSTGQNQLDLTTNFLYFETGNVGWPNAQLLRGYDLYAAKIRSDSLMETYWSGVVGGSQDDYSAGYTGTYYDFTPLNSNSVATDLNGNVFIIGYSNSFNYPRTSNVVGEANREGTVVISKIATDGSAYVYSSGMNTSFGVYPVGVAVDGAGNASVTGLVKVNWGFNYTGTLPNPLPPNIDTGVGNIQVTSDALKSTYTWIAGNSNGVIATDDAWINVLNSTCTTLLYGSYIGGDGNDTISYPFVDQFGDIWVYGLHDNFYGYTINAYLATPPQTTFIKPIYQSYVTPFPAGFITPLAFKINPDGPGSVGATDDPANYGVEWESNYPNYPNPSPPGTGGNYGTVQTYETTDGYVLRFRIGLPVISSVTLAPNTVPGGLLASTVGTITLSSAAPIQGADVTVTINSNRAAAQFSGAVPYSVIVTIPSGSTTGTFTITTNAVTAATPVQIEANYEGNIKYNNLTVVPWLQKFSVTPTVIAGGNNVIATVTLAAAATASNATSTGVDVVVDTSDSSGVVLPGSEQYFATTLPLTVTVPTGTTSISVPITTAIVSAQTTVNLAAYCQGVDQVAAVTLTPLSIGISSLQFSNTTLNAGQTATGTVTLTTPAPDAGLSVTLTSSDPSIAFFNPVPGTPYPNTLTIAIAPNSLTGTFTINAGTLADTGVATFTAATSSSSVSTDVTVNQVTFTVVLAPTTTPGGGTATGTITLAAPTTMDALTLSVTPSDTTVVPAIGDVTIAANGATVGTFSAVTNKVTSSSTVNIDVVLGTIAPEDVQVSLGVTAPGLTSFSFRQSTIRSLKSDIGTATLDATVSQDTPISITYGPTGTTSPSVYFSHSTTSVYVLQGSQVSQPVTVTAKRFTRPITVPVQAGIVGSSTVANTTITITR